MLSRTGSSLSEENCFSFWCASSLIKSRSVHLLSVAWVALFDKDVHFRRLQQGLFCFLTLPYATDAVCVLSFRPRPTMSEDSDPLAGLPLLASLTVASAPATPQVLPVAHTDSSGKQGGVTPALGIVDRGEPTPIYNTPLLLGWDFPPPPKVEDVCNSLT